METLDKDFKLNTFLLTHQAIKRDAEKLLNLKKKMNHFNDKEINELCIWFTRFQKVILLHHKAEEKILFKGLKKREIKVEDIIKKLIKEHVELESAVHRIQELLKKLNDSVTKKRDLQEIETQIKKIHHHIMRHSEEEDNKIIPIIKRKYNKLEQRFIEYKVGLHTSPSMYKFLIPWIEQDLSERQKQIYNASIPLPLRVMNARFWRKKYQNIAKILS